MKTSWTHKVEKELAVDITQNFKESLVMRKRLLELLQDKIDVSLRATRQKDGYDNPNWAYLQADARGYERAISEIISLISD